MIIEALICLILCFLPLFVYTGVVLLWSIPERISPRTYPAKPICKKFSCLRCSMNITALNRAKLFVDNALLFSPSTVSKSVSESLSNENRLLFQMTNLCYRPLWNSTNWGPKIAADVQKLESGYATIKLACQQILKSPKMWQRKEDTSGANWFIFSLLKNGLWCNENCNLQPELMELIHSLKSIMHKCAFGNIYFSLLPPKTKIATHHGPTNIRLKCHLTLEIPNDEKACFMNIQENKVLWEEKKCTIFEDSLPHSFSNLALKEDRVALILDFWHPSLSSSEKVTIRRAFPQTE